MLECSDVIQNSVSELPLGVFVAAAPVMKGSENMKNPIKPAFEKYAIIQTGGKQYQAIPGRTIAIEKIEGASGAALQFPEVVFRKNGEGKFEFGQPFVKGASVKASIVKQTKGPKIIVFKFKRRKKYRLKRGHRQQMTVVRIEAI